MPVPGFHIKKRRPRKRKWLITITLLVLAIAGSGITYWIIHRKQLVREQLEATIIRKSQGLYRISYDHLVLDEVAGHLTIQQLRLSYDSTRYLQMAAKGTAPGILLRIFIPELTITGVKTPRALIDREIVGSYLKLEAPQLELYYTNKGADSLRHTPSMAMYRQILGDLDLIRLDSVIINHATIHSYRYGDTSHLVQLKNVNLQLHQLSVDSLSEQEYDRILFSKQVVAQVSDASWHTGDQRYLLRAQEIAINSRAREATLQSFNIQPLLGEAAFTRSLKYADDRFDVNIQGMQLYDFRLNALLNDTLVADSIHIASATLNIYRDLALPHDGKSRLGKYPHQALEKFGLATRINTLKLAGGSLTYKERNAKTRMAGAVHFAALNAHIKQISNFRPPDGQQAFMEARISSRFLNQVPLHVYWRFSLFHPQGQFSVQGKMGALPAAALNPVTEPMGPARIENGKIEELSFQFTGHNRGMSGRVQILYEDLKVTLLEKKEDRPELSKKKLASLVANLVIRKSNPGGKKDKPRVAVISQQRDTRRSIFHLSWKALFKGIKTTVGINK